MIPAFKKIFMVLVVLGILGVVLNYKSLTGRGLVYRESSYEKNCVWQGIEVGRVFRQPIGSVIVRGRHRCVIAFPEGKKDQARILYATNLGENAPPLDFVSADGSKVTYRTREGDVVLDVSQWASKPPLTTDKPGA